MIETMITSSVLILAICFLRFLLKGKINPGIQYALWGLVAVRLLAGLVYPLRTWLFRFQSRFSVMNAADQFKERVISGTAMEPLADNLVSGRVYTFDHTENLMLKAAGIDWQLWIMVIWCIGTVGLAVWMCFVNMKLYKNLQHKRKLYEGKLPEFVTKTVYAVSDLPSPCYFAMGKDDAIYLPSHVAQSEVSVRHALAHEMGHVLQGDRGWGGLRCSLLCLFWINPLVWVAAVLSKRDAEQSCDEIAVKLLGEQERFLYGRTLVGLISSNKESNSLFCSATTMVEGRKAIKDRITILAKNPKRTVSMTILAGCAVVVLGACTFTSSLEEGTESGMSREAIMALEETKAESSFNHDTDESASRSPDGTELTLEKTGQWGNSYRLQMTGIAWDAADVVSLTMYEDASGTKMIGNGVPQEMYGYGENSDGSVGVDFWNTENAGSVRIAVKREGTTIAEALYKTDNEEPYGTYSLHQEIEGMGGSSVTLVSAEEYPNALCLNLRGDSETALRQFLERNVILLKQDGVTDEQEWIEPSLSSMNAVEDGEWRLLYRFEEDVYPMLSVEALVCGQGGNRSEYIVNELEYHRIQETAFRFIQAYMTGDTETAKKYGDFSEEELLDFMEMAPQDSIERADMMALYKPEEKDVCAQTVFRFRAAGDDDSYTYLNLELKLAFGEWKVISKLFEK